jgi:tRNA dimethylallyltransferase
MGTEIVNGDSMQVYRHMDIGTAKPTPEERARVKHHLLDVVDPDEPFDAARYLDLARPVIDALHRERKIPLVVGGTGLYMKILTKSICPAAPGDPRAREELQKELEASGLAGLHAELLRVDPVLGERIHPNDRQRILRALEVYRISGAPLSHWQSRHRFCETLYPSIKVFLYRDRKEMYERIDRRVLVMLDQGFEGEVRRLLEVGYGPELKSMQSLGYKEMARFITGQCSLDEAVSGIQRETRRYAKRQMTWFRGDPEFKWFHAEDKEGILGWMMNRISQSVRQGEFS